MTAMLFTGRRGDRGLVDTPLGDNCLRYAALIFKRIQILTSLIKNSSRVACSEMWESDKRIEHESNRRIVKIVIKRLGKLLNSSSGFWLSSR